MQASETPRRSLTGRLLPWLVPVVMILVGLVLVSTGLTDADEPTPRDVAPANVRSVFVANAPTWATGQVGVENVTEIDDIVMVGANATGASTYRAKAVIVRVDSRVLPLAVAGDTVATLAEADTSTVATCVEWDVDVTTGTYTPVSAIEIARQTGRHDLTDGDDATSALRALCPRVS